MYTYTFYSHPYLFGYFVRAAEAYGNELHFSIYSVISDTSSVSNSYTSSIVSQSDYAKNTFKDLLPMAVRSTFSSLDTNYYLVERPPFQAKIDYSKNQSYCARKPDKSIQGKEMWIPWTAMLIAVPKGCTYFNQIKFNLYFNDSPISSDDDFLLNSFFPNSSNSSATICIGGTLSNISFDQPDPPLKEIVNIIYNDYFSGGWNSDIHNHLRYNKAMLPAIERLEQNDPKTYAKTDLRTVKQALSNASEQYAIYSNYGYNYVEFFYLYSEMTFEETMSYYHILKQAHINKITNSYVTKVASMFDHLEANSFSIRTGLFSHSLSASSNVGFNCIQINQLISNNSEVINSNIVISDYDNNTADFTSYIKHPQIIADVFSRIIDMLSNQGNASYVFPYRLEYSTKTLSNVNGDLYADAF